jgi:hypothetical protein
MNDWTTVKLFTTNKKKKKKKNKKQGDERKRNAQHGTEDGEVR